LFTFYLSVWKQENVTPVCHSNIKRQFVSVEKGFIWTIWLFIYRIADFLNPQHGFIKNKSGVNYLLEFIDSISEAAERYEPTYTVLCTLTSKSVDN
jgi:hypothetical protein